LIGGTVPDGVLAGLAAGLAAAVEEDEGMPDLAHLTGPLAVLRGRPGLVASAGTLAVLVLLLVAMTLLGAVL
jgi:hypothetical protein